MNYSKIYYSKYYFVLLHPRVEFKYCPLLVTRFHDDRKNAFYLASTTNQGNVVTFFLKVSNQSFSLRYHVNGTNINSISADKDNTSILIALSPNTGGTLNIELPRSVIDSKGQGNFDKDYIVFADGQHIGAEQTVTNNRLRTLGIVSEKGVNQIEIAGTLIVPEFGQLNGLLLSVSIIGTVAVVMKYRRLGKTWLMYWLSLAAALDGLICSIPFVHARQVTKDV